MPNGLTTSLIKDWSSITKTLVICGAVLFGLSLLFTSFYTSEESISGLWLLIIGWLGFAIAQLAWFANPINLLALLILSKNPKLSLLLSAVALFLAYQTFFITEIPMGTGQQVLFIKEMGLGVYFWFLAQVFFLVGIVVETIEKRAGGFPATSI